MLNVDIYYFQLSMLGSLETFTSQPDSLDLYLQDVYREDPLSPPLHYP